MLNRFFALAIFASVIGTPFLILLAQKVDGPASDMTRFKVYDRCETGSVHCTLRDMKIPPIRA